MKKLLLSIVAILFFVTACEGPTGPMGPAGPQGEQGETGTSWFTRSYTIKASDWKLSGKPGELNSFYYVSIPVSELTKFIYESGTVLAYIETEPGIKNSLPYVSHRGGSDDKGEFLWTQTYDFDFQVNEITFYLTYSDFNTKVEPGTETVHVIFMS